MNAPERIYNWEETQLSVARFYGGINYNGHRYEIAYCEPGQPLVRWDVAEREEEALFADQTDEPPARDTMTMDMFGGSDE